MTSEYIYWCTKRIHHTCLLTDGCTGVGSYFSLYSGAQLSLGSGGDMNLHPAGFRTAWTPQSVREGCVKAKLLKGWHILVSYESKISQSGVILYGISHHFITFCTRMIFKAIFMCHKTVRIRGLKKYCERFREVVSKIDWSPVLDSVGVDSAWEVFKCRFLDVVNVMAPIKRVGVKQRSSPWFNQRF